MGGADDETNVSVIIYVVVVWIIMVVTCSIGIVDNKNYDDGTVTEFSGVI